MAPPHKSHAAKADDSVMSDFDRHRKSLLKHGNSVETCGAEVRRYLKTVEEDVERDTNIVEWWQVSYWNVLSY
jgi:hypothetical protein